MKDKAFTLAESLLVLAILGVIAAITIPVIWHARPDQGKMLFKKAYYDAERVTSDMINDENLYPESVETKPDFSDAGEAIVLGRSYVGPTKFCALFADKINISGDVKCGNSDVNPADNIASTNPTFKTNNGIQWFFPKNNPEMGEEIEIIVDINGVKGPNCRYRSTTLNDQSEKCKNPDRFSMFIRSDGKMTVKGVQERESLDATEIR